MGRLPWLLMKSREVDRGVEWFQSGGMNSHEQQQEQQIDQCSKLWIFPTGKNLIVELKSNLEIVYQGITFLLVGHNG